MEAPVSLLLCLLLLPVVVPCCWGVPVVVPGSQLRRFKCSCLLWVRKGCDLNWHTPFTFATFTQDYKTWKMTCFIHKILINANKKKVQINPNVNFCLNPAKLCHPWSILQKESTLTLLRASSSRWIYLKSTYGCWESAF